MIDQLRRIIAHYDFEGGGFVTLTAGGVDTEQALDMAGEFIRLKREELAAKKERTP